MFTEGVALASDDDEVFINSSRQIRLVDVSTVEHMVQQKALVTIVRQYSVERM